MVAGPDEVKLVVRAVSLETGEALDRGHLVVVPSGRNPSGWRCRQFKGLQSAPGEPLQDDGSMTFFVPAQAPCRVVFGMPDLVLGRDRGEDVPALAAGTRREIVLEVPSGPDWDIAGRVVEKGSGASIAGARVRIASGKYACYDGISAHSMSTLARAETDGEGRFELQFAVANYSALLVEAPGYALSFVRLGSFETRQVPLVVRVERGASLELRIVDAAGAPRPGTVARVTTEGVHVEQNGRRDWPRCAEDPSWFATADADGRCRIADLPPRAPLAIALLERGLIVRKEPRPLELESGERRELVLRIGAGAEIRGEAFDQEGEPVAKLEVRLCAQGEDSPPIDLEKSIDKTFSDGDGLFAFRDVGPGTWWVVPVLWDPQARTPGDTAGSPEKVVVRQGAGRVDLELRLYRGLTIEGRVEWTDGEAAPRARVFASSNTGHSAYGISGADGAFVVKPLLPGDYELTAQVHDATGPVSSGAVLARAGERGVRVTLGR
jgi:hypothetical protein